MGLGSVEAVIKPSKSPSKVRSHTSLATYPSLEAKKKTLDNFCWNLQGGARQVVKFESPMRSLSLKERRAFQRNLMAKGPVLFSTAAKARGAANRYS